MLQLWSNRRQTDCNGTTRRDFLKVGALGMGGLMLPDLLRARARLRPRANRPATPPSSGCGWAVDRPTSKPSIPRWRRRPSSVAPSATSPPTCPASSLGSVFPRMARMADKFAFVRSFAHNNSGHGGGTHWVMTGYDFPPADNGMGQNRARHRRHHRALSRRQQSRDRSAELRPPRRYPRRRPVVARLGVRSVRHGRQRPQQHEFASDARPARRAAQPAPLVRHAQSRRRSLGSDAGSGQLRDAGVRPAAKPGA